MLLPLGFSREVASRDYIKKGNYVLDGTSVMIDGNLVPVFPGGYPKVDFDPVVRPLGSDLQNREVRRQGLGRNTETEHTIYRASNNVGRIIMGINLNSY